MSEPVLNAIMRLFALLAKEDQITKQEREFIHAFLSDHLSEKGADNHMQLFDEFAIEISNKLSATQEKDTILEICRSINKEVAQKQKVVIMLELLSVIMADGTMSAREQSLAQIISDSLYIQAQDLSLITHYLVAKNRDQINHDDILVIDSKPEMPRAGRHILREGLDGFISILYIRSTDTFFFKYIGHTDVFKYIGHTDVYLNGVPQKSGNINVLAIGSTIRWDAADAVYFGEILNLFKKEITTTRTSFEAKAISYTFKNGKLGLREVDIEEESGNLVALMGASGAGKSTLLHVLNGTEKPSAGQVLINGTIGRASIN